MKNSLICLFLLLSVASFGKDTNPSKLIDQLTELNKYWLVNADALDPVIPAVNLSETEMIRLHLQLVEKTLRARNPNQLSEAQQFNRSRTLDILHSYWQAGVFPQNIFHHKRTPYFIDHLNTACAVGYLIIQTGYADLANQIASEKNYAYIEDMHYPKMVKWANEFGFTLDELKWIQPGYCIVYCEPQTIRHVSCHGENDGCIGAFYDVNGLPNESLLFTGASVYDSTSKSWYDTWPCDLFPGTYRMNYIVGETGDEYYTYHEILGPPRIDLQLYAAHSTSDCTGSIMTSVSGGVEPYSFIWSTGDTTSEINNLCEGSYELSVVDANGCVKIEGVMIELESGNENLNQANVNLYPNPVQDYLHITYEASRLKNGNYKIVNAIGHEILTGDISPDIMKIDLRDLPDGAYFLKLYDESGYVLKKFIKD